MKTSVVIIAFLIHAFLAVIIIAHVRQGLRRKRQLERAMRLLDDVPAPEVTSHGLRPSQLDFYRDAARGMSHKAEAESLLERFRARHPNIVKDWEESDLIRPEGKTEDRIIPLPAPWGFHPSLDDDEGEPLPGAMLAPPNIGGVDRPDYKGANYAAPEDVAEEMKRTIYYDKPDGEEFTGTPTPAFNPARYRKD